MRTILLIEDDAISCQALTDVLEYYCYSVVAVRFGAIGIQMALAYQPDVILCDVMLPDILGWDVLQQVRGPEAIAATPFIFLTSLDERRYMRKGMILGADDYILKPVSNKDLHQTLEALFQKQERLAKPYIAEMKRVTQELQSIIYKDYLTGLPNRLGFKEYIQPYLQLGQTQVSEAGVCLFIFAIEAWSDLVVAYGKDITDQLVIHLSQRLHHGLKDQGTTFQLAHLDADQFGLFCLDMDDRGKVIQLVESFVEYLQQPYTLPNQCIQITVKAGICQHPEGIMTDPETWISCGRVALQWAKQHPSQPYQFYEQLPGKTTLEWCQLKLDLGTALEHDQMIIQYQPIFSLTTNEVEQVEALLRWQHPKKGKILPAKFIPMAEEAHNIAQFDLWVIAQGLKQVQSWGNHEMGEALRVSFNLSPQTIRQPDLMDSLDRILSQNQVPPHWITIELTETSLFSNLDATQQVLYQLKDRGIQIALDDFGRGYSSLHYLRALPLNTLKIDHHLVQHLESHPQNQAILKAIVRMAQSLALKVVAKGVETEKQLDFLLSQGYHSYQGFLSCGPLNAEAMLEFLQRRADRRSVA